MMPQGQTPRHVGIIMDGNRRWAQKNGLRSTFLGHKKGAEIIGEIITCGIKSKVDQITFYAMSIENLSRNKSEVDYLLRLALVYLRADQTQQFCNANNVKLNIIGEWQDLLPTKLSQEISQFKNKLIPKDGDKITINIALCYSAKHEICNAAKAAIENDKILNITTLEKHLYVSDIDLLIRTGGELRISNFLLWQSAYAELYFSEKMWPDFNPEDFCAAIAAYNARLRRYGK